MSGRSEDAGYHAGVICRLTTHQNFCARPKVVDRLLAKLGGKTSDDRRLTAEEARSATILAKLQCNLPLQRSASGELLRNVIERNTRAALLGPDRHVLIV